MRIIKIILTALIIAANIPIVYAENTENIWVRMDGIYESLKFINAVSNFQDAEYTWYLSDSAYEFGEQIGSGNRIFLNSEMENKYIRVLAVDNEGNMCTSDFEKINSTLSNKCDTDFFQAKKTSPDADKFYIDGMGFILLDTTESDSSHFLVMSDKIVGERFYSNSNNQLFSDLCAFLNNQSDVVVYSYDEAETQFVDDYTMCGYKGNESYIQLPNVIMSNIDNDHIWKNEPAKVGWYSWTEVATVGGIAVPSLSDIKKYSDKIGVSESFWLRTPRGLSGSGREMLYVSAGNRGHINAMDSKTGISGIRPIFYLDKSFFVDAAISITDLGYNVKKSIRNTYSRKELENIYSELELNNFFGYPKVCSMENVEIKNEYGVPVLSLDNENLFVSFDLQAGEGGFSGSVQIKSISHTVSENISIASGEKKNISIPITFNILKDETINLSLKNLQGDIICTQDIKSENINAYIVGINETYNTLEIKYNSKINLKVAVEWQVADSQNGSYKKITENERLTVKSEYAEKYIRAKITAEDGTSGITDAVYINPAYERQSEFSADDNINTQRITPVENIFFVDGSKFILLDIENSDESKFLVMSAKSLKKTTFLGGSENEDYSQMNEYLNGEFLEEEYIPQKILRHINENAVWKCEPVKYPISNNEERAYIGGIALPSVTEYKKYADKINVYDEMGWWTRTPSGSLSGGTGIIAPSGDDTQIGIFYLRTSEELGIRPIFYLDRNFFLSERIDIDSMGDNVRKAIFDTYTKSELENIYTIEEIGTIFDKGNVNFSLEPLIDANNPYINIVFRKKTEEAIEYKIGLETTGGESFFSNVVFPEGESEMSYDFSIANLSYGTHEVTVYAEVDGIRTNVKYAKVTFMPFYEKQFMDNIVSFKGYCESAIIYDSAASEYYKASGANAIRNGVVEWHEIEKEKGVYDFSELDKVVETICNMGSEPVLLLCYSNELYMPSENKANKNGPNTKESIDAFAKMAAATAARYPQVKYFEVYNEANLEFFWQPWHNYVDYAYLTKVTGAEIKKVSPNAVVVGGVVGEDGEWFIRSIYDKNVYPYLDAISFHPYIFSNSGRADGRYQSKLDSMIGSSRINGGFKDQIITEIGWSNFTSELHGCSEETQAIENTKQYIYNDINSIAYTAAYNFVDCGYDETDKENRFGVIDFDGIPKMAYAANSTLFRMIGGAVYFGSLETKDNITTALYSKNSQPLAIMWSNADGGNSDERITLSFPNETLTVMDMYGNEIYKNISTFSVDKRPVYVTGFSNEIFLESFKDTYASNIDHLLRNAGVSEYAYLFESMKRRVDQLDALSNKYEAMDILKTHFRIADNAINKYKNKEIICDFEKLISFMNVVYESAETAEAYLMVVSQDYSYKSVAQDRINDAEEIITEKKAGITGARLPYAEAVLKIAKQRLEESQKVEEIEESNPQKNGVIRAWRQKAWLMAQTAIRIALIEEVTHDDIIVQSASGDKKPSKNESGVIETAIYNYGDVVLDAVVRVTTKDGTILGESKILLKAGENALVNINLAATSDTYAYIEIVENDIVIQSEYCVITK